MSVSPEPLLLPLPEPFLSESEPLEPLLPSDEPFLSDEPPFSCGNAVHGPFLQTACFGITTLPEPMVGSLEDHSCESSVRRDADLPNRSAARCAASPFFTMESLSAR